MTMSDRMWDVLHAVDRAEVYRVLDPPIREEWQPTFMSDPITDQLTEAVYGLKARGLIRLHRQDSYPAIAGGRRVWMWRTTPAGRWELEHRLTTRDPGGA